MTAQPAETDRERRILVRAPIARDCAVTGRLLLRATLAHVLCLTLRDLVAALAAGAAALLLTEEALDEDGFDALIRAIDEQPPWADIPVLLLAGSERRRADMRTLQRARPLGNVILLERPIHMAAVLSAVESALRSRARQYELRDVLATVRDAREQAEASNRIRDEFLSTLSHELRTPLNAMLGWASMLRSGQVHGPLIVRAHEIIERNARAQHALVADLLDVSRIITGKIALSPSPVLVAPLLMAAIDTVAAAADAKRVTLRTHLDSPDAMVVGDQARLQQVFWNLVSNAVKFTPGGGTVDVEVRLEGDAVLVSVSDTGIGIDPAFLASVFDRFRQADSTTTRMHGGLGLGLAIVRHLVELHGGRIEVRSQGVGMGATFRVSLPQMHATGVSPPSQPAAGIHEQADLDGVRALVVDDDDDARELLGVILREAGVRPSLANGTSEALSLIASGPPFDVVLCDLATSGRDGFARVAAIRAASHGPQHAMPVIGVTACAGQPEEARAHEAGCNLCLAKPIEAYAVTHALGTLLRRHERRRAGSS